MFFFFPYSTDAPIYYWPIATVGLIVVNVLVFFGVVTGSIPNPEGLILSYGEGLTPLQWLTSMFMHGDLMHLLGNMVFLWVFGLVVEGKLGWWKFLACYLGIGILQSVLEQSLQLMVGGEGVSLGASSAIYGILAMAAIWAPKNEVSFFYFFWIFIFVRTGIVEIPLMYVAGLYIGLDVLGFFLQGLNSSSWLHVGGVVFGAPLGVFLLKRGYVNCEGWDIFTVGRGEHGRKLNAERERDEAELAEKRQLRDSQIVENARNQINTLVQQKNTDGAFALYKKLNNTAEGLLLSRPVLLHLISQLHAAKKWQASCPLMAEVLSRFPDEDNDAVRLKLAQICVVELSRPGKALELLKEIDLRSLPAEQLKLTHKIAHRAKQLQHEGTVELDDDGW